MLPIIAALSLTLRLHSSHTDVNKPPAHKAHNDVNDQDQCVEMANFVNLKTLEHVTLSTQHPIL